MKGKLFRTYIIPQRKLFSTPKKTFSTDSFSAIQLVDWELTTPCTEAVSTQSHLADEWLGDKVRGCARPVTLNSVPSLFLVVPVFSVDVTFLSVCYASVLYLVGSITTNSMHARERAANRTTPYFVSVPSTALPAGERCALHVDQLPGYVMWVHYHISIQNQPRLSWATESSIPIFHYRISVFVCYCFQLC